MKDCATRYPILLLHGLFRKDSLPRLYWGRVPDILRAHGARVYLGGQAACATVEDNSIQLRSRILAILRRENCEKINIIAHSKGGLEARHLISTLGMAPHVASLSTISTPHLGVKSLDIWCEMEQMLDAVGRISDAIWRLAGDHDSNFAAAVRQLRASAMKDFNAGNPNRPEVFYQSWGASLGASRDDKLMVLSSRFFQEIDGETDGLVSPDAAHWGLYRGTVRDVSHRVIAGSREGDLDKFCIELFYISLVRDLVRRGF